MKEQDGSKGKVSFLFDGDVTAEKIVEAIKAQLGKTPKKDDKGVPIPKDSPDVKESHEVQPTERTGEVSMTKRMKSSIRSPLDVQNKAFDEIVTGRRSIRSFTMEVPPRATIELILAAGLAAPFAEAAVGNARDFRRFAVFPQGGQALDSVISFLREKGKAQLDAIQGREPKDAPFFKKLEALANGRIPGLGTAPYLIAVAERKGTPSVEQQSIAHCLQNMWLKATALGLGFHVVSALAMLADEPRFWALCGLPAGVYDLNGCAIGVPALTPPAKPRPTVAEATIWLG